MKGQGQIEFKALWVISAIIGIMAVALLFMMWVPLNPIVLKSVTIVNADKKVEIGSPVCFRVEYTKFTNKHGLVVRQLINDRVVNYTPHISRVPIGEGSGVDCLHTGQGDSPGKYRVNYTVIYKYFGFREVSTSLLSDEFQIIAGRTSE